MNELTTRPYTTVGTTPTAREEAVDAPRKLLLTVQEAAQRLSIGRPKMYELIMRGTVLSVKIGASRRIPTAALEAYVEQLSVDAAFVAQRRESHGK